MTGRRRLLTLAGALLPGLAGAQTPPPPGPPPPGAPTPGPPAPNRGTAASAAVPNVPPPPLQPEPGDVWADVKTWDTAHRKRMGLTEEPAKPAAKPAPAKPARRRQ